MLIYSVTWKADDELIKGKGRIKSSEYLFSFTVLCRNSKDATSCLEYLFELNYNGKFSLCDGVVTLKRCKLDSRNFTFQYLLMDGMKKPLFMRDVSQALDCYHTSLYQKSVYSKQLLQA